MDEPETSDMMNVEDEEEIISNDVGEENTEVTRSHEWSTRTNTRSDRQLA